MKNQWINFAMVGVLNLAFSSAHALKVGVVDLQRALQEVKAGKAAKLSLEKEFQEKKKKLDKEQDEIRKMIEDFQKKSMALSQEARAQRGMELQKRQGEWQESVQSSQADIQKREANLTRPILEGLRTMIESLAEDKKTELVLEVNTGGLLFAADKVDLTDELIKKYDAKK